MKLQRKDKNRTLYLFIRQDNGKSIELGFTTLFKASLKAQRMARQYLFDNLDTKETTIKVKTCKEVITEFYAIRLGGCVKVLNY